MQTAPSLNRFKFILDDEQQKTPQEINALRIKEDERLAEKMGLALPPPIYTVGTPVIELGKDNFKLSRQNWEAMPTARQAAKALVEVIHNEQREDFTINPRSLQADSGLIRLPDGQALPITRTALRQLATAVGGAGTYAGSYLTHVEQDVRDYCLNKHFDAPARKDDVKVRTARNSDGNRYIYAVVGPKFPNFDADRVLETVQDSVPAEARAEVLYSGDGGVMQLDALYHSDISPEDAAAGEIFKVGFRVRSADNGTNSYKVSLLAYRNLCLNFIIIGSSVVDIGTLTHRGQSERIRKEIQNMISTAVEKTAEFSHRWGQARQDQVLVETDDHLKSIYLKLLETGKLKVKGNKSDVADALVRAFRVETELKDATRADVINAITRYAHTSAWSPSSWTETSSLEEQAGELLFARVQLAA
jgi:hypothetical protein